MRLPTGVIGVAHSWHAFSSGAARGEARKGFVSCTWRRLGPLHVTPVGGVALLGSVVSRGSTHRWMRSSVVGSTRNSPRPAISAADHLGSGLE
jgi:hypothetical protein